MQPIIKPRRLKPGDTIGVVSPASPANEDETVRIAIDTVASLGFKVKEGRHIYARYGYLAGSDAQRAEDLNAMFADDEVDGIITLRGGYGTPRILPYLDFETMRRHPKVLMGYSDITGLLNSIFHKAGLVTFHGPIAGQSFTPYTLAEFLRVVVNAESGVCLGSPPPFEAAPGRVERENRLVRLVGGKARGQLIGGNLSLMSALSGSPYCPDFAGKILFLEDVEEASYRVDRMLTQLWLTGGLNQLAGLAFGKFTKCGTTASWAHQLTVEEVLTTRCRELGIPALYGLMIGHVDNQTTLPLGCQAELDADAGTLRLLESGVL